MQHPPHSPEYKREYAMTRLNLAKQGGNKKQITVWDTQVKHWEREIEKQTPRPLEMFPSGSDLPLFSLTPVKAQESQYHPAPAAYQPRLFGCPVCMGTKQHAGKPCPACK